jgi:hypothetical protein
MNSVRGHYADRDAQLADESPLAKAAAQVAPGQGACGYGSLPAALGHPCAMTIVTVFVTQPHVLLAVMLTG